MTVPMWTILVVQGACKHVLWSDQGHNDASISQFLINFFNDARSNLGRNKKTTIYKLQCPANFP
jgi:hypothetical protein